MNGRRQQRDNSSTVYSTQLLICFYFRLDTDCDPGSSMLDILFVTEKNIHRSTAYQLRASRAHMIRIT